MVIASRSGPAVTVRCTFLRPLYRFPCTTAFTIDSRTAIPILCRSSSGNPNSWAISSARRSASSTLSNADSSHRSTFRLSLLAFSPMWFRSPPHPDWSALGGNSANPTQHNRTVNLAKFTPKGKGHVLWGRPFRAAAGLLPGVIQPRSWLAVCRPALRGAGPIPGPGPQRPRSPAPTRYRTTGGPSTG